MARKFNFWNGRQRNSGKARRSGASRRRRGSAHREASLGVERLEDRYLLAAGALDTTFNPAGVLPGTQIGNLFFGGGESIAVQADGKILVAGTRQTGGANSQNFAVARYLSNGQIDTTFGAADLDGVNGLTTADFFGNQDVAFDMKIDSLGRILVAGRAFNAAGSVQAIAVARFDTNGVLDPTFDGDGKAFHALPGLITETRGIALQNDGKIVVTGIVRTGAAITNDFMVARLNSNGSLDTAGFGSGTGFVTTDFGSNRSDSAFDVAIQSDGRIVAAGQVSIGTLLQFGLARYNTDGTLDTSFDLDGKVSSTVGLSTAQSNIRGVAIQADGRIIVTGNNGSGNTIDVIVARYTTSGLLDSTFNTTGAGVNSAATQPGMLRINILPVPGSANTRDFGEGLVIQPDGNYVISGASSNVVGSTQDGRLLALRVSAASGTLDSSFGSGGISLVNLVLPPGSQSEALLEVAMQPDGKIIAAGAFNDVEVLARFESDLVVAPTIAGAADTDEGDVYTLNLSSGDPTTSQWTISWGDSVEIVPGNPSSVTHVYADGDASYTISATVTTSTGTFAAGNTVDVDVHNVAPTLAISGASDVDEGDLYTLNLSSSDPGDDTIASWTINWGDSVEVVAGDPASATHTYADGDANYTISASATDEDGTFAAANMVAVAVLNVAPALALSGASNVDEAAVYTLNLSSFDPGDDTITSWTINWGDSIEVVAGNPASVTHTYADGDANYTISATATDEDGTFAAGNTVDVMVDNVAPTLAINGASDVDEAAIYTLNLSSSDPGDDTITSWTINWGDSVEVVAGDPASVTHTYADGDVNYTIIATATDEDGTFASGNTVDVMVDNVAPTLTLSGASDVDEADVYTLNLSSFDPGDDTITSWTINWGDSVEVVAGNPTSVTHTYADGDANYTISATATDEDGTFAAGNTVDVLVHNVAPTLAINGASDVDEAAVYTLNLSSSDPGDDTITSWTINWGDSVEVVAGNPASVTHTYADGDANYTISATATDEDGTFAAGNTVDVMVENVAQALAINGASSVDEANVYTLNLSSSDPGDDTITSWTINWGDSVEVVSGNPSSVTHTYADGDASYNISATATDEDGTFAAGNTVAVLVLNVAPALAISGASNVNEGSLYTLNLASSDPGDDTITSWTINWGDSVQIVSGNPASVTHTYADGNANYTISATATDEDGTFAAGNTVGVTVNNVAPTLSISGASSVNEGSLYTLNLSSSDSGIDTIASWTINWGDSTQVVVGNPSSVAHTYADGNASYTISATATDEDGTFAAGNTVGVTVSNVAPTLAISGASSVNEASTYTLNLSSSDPGSDTISSWTINWGDGTQVVSGNPSSVTHTYADGTTNFTITATATDEDGTFAAGNTVSVTVQNVAPTADAGGPYFTFDDTPITLNGSGSDVAGAADPLSYSWDLDNNGTFETSGQNAVFDPEALGYSGNQTRTVKLRVSDGDGGVTIDTATVEILGTGTVVIGGVLHIVGSDNCDIVIITRICDNIVVIASFNDHNPMVFDASSITEIQVRTRGGTDIVLTTSNVTTNMTIDGGSGNDLLTGGGGRNVIYGGSGHDVLYGAGGNDVLFGGTGNDDIFGGSGNDVLVGGSGCDYLEGGSGRDVIIGSQDEDELRGGDGDDILIGGYTAHDNNLAALDAIMSIWGSSASFSSRVAQLSSSGGLLQAGVTVFDDDDCDEIVGNSGRDLIFGDTYRWDGAIDSISLQSSQDVLIAVN